MQDKEYPENHCFADICCGDEENCTNPDRIKEVSIIVRTDLEKLADAMAKTSAGIQSFREKTLEAANDLVAMVNSLESDLDGLPEGMMRSWLSFYTSGLEEVQAAYAKALGQ